MNNNIKHNQEGMVSILVTMIMMIVISLIVIGFSQVTRHNQREALNNQLSTQAYYAAESGINYAQKAIKDAIIANPANPAYPSSSTCTGFSPTFATDSILNSANGTAFTCLLVNPTPTSLQATPLNSNSNIVWHIKDGTVPAQAIATLTFSWTKDSSVNVNGSPVCSALPGKFPSVDKWKGPGNFNCNLALLRVDLVQDPGSTIGAAALAQKTITLYLKPFTSAGPSPTLPANFSSGPRAVIAQCKATSAGCAVTVTLNGAAGSEYYARLSTLYENSGSVSVTGTEVGGTGLPFADGQAIIDSTGKAVDELRRIQVRIPLTQQPGGTRLPNFGVQLTGSICKLLTVGPGVYEDGSATNPDCN